MAMNQRGKTATLYRMVMPDHLCPFGLKSKDLLERQGFAVEDHHLTTRDETEAFMKKHGVETTPQTVIVEIGSAAMTIFVTISATRSRTRARPATSRLSRSSQSLS